MKHILTNLIKVYQNLISPIVKQVFGVKAFCRYPQTCSSYALQKIEKYGAMKGSALAVKRLLSCQPFGRTHEYI